MTGQEMSAMQTALRNCRALQATEWWSIWPETHLARAIFTSLMIDLKDVLQLLARLGYRVDFRDDIPNDDITDLVRNVRNAACHLGSPERLARNIGEFSFNVFTGKSEADFNGRVLGCPYPDDAAVYYGDRRLLVRRHLDRAIAEGEAKLRQAAADSGMLMPLAL